MLSGSAFPQQDSKSRQLLCVKFTWEVQVSGVDKFAPPIKIFLA